jgi:hypothetical protein
MDRDLTQEEKEKIINLGAMQYDEDKMAIVLGWEKDEVKKEMGDANSEVKKLYNKGSVLSEYILNVKLFEMAKAGDLKALEKFKWVVKNQNQ